jgi:hypothetical protein
MYPCRRYERKESGGVVERERKGEGERKERGVGETEKKQGDGRGGVAYIAKRRIPR